MLIEDKKIELWAYNVETILAEKMQTILARSTLNTRMRDFYDVYVLMSVYGKNIDYSTLESAFKETCKKRWTYCNCD